MSQPAKTLLLISRQHIAHVDLGSGARPRVQGQWTHARPETPHLAEAVEITLALGGKPARQVYVFSTDWWTQVLSLPGSRVAGMKPAEQAAAFAYEAEAFSGHAAFESSAAFVPLNPVAGQAQFWILQIRHTDRDQIDDVIRRSGGRLAGLAHPGGVSCSLHEKQSSKVWQRLELWPDAVLCVRGKAGKSVDLHVLNSDPPLGRWKQEWQAWRDAQPVSDGHEVLVESGLATTGFAPDDYLIALENEGALCELGGGLGRLALDRKEPGVPLLRPLRKPLSTQARLALVGTLCLLLALSCLLHLLWLDGENQAAQAEIAEAGKPAKQFAELDKQNKDVKAKRDDLKAQDERLTQFTKAIIHQRQRLGVMLAVLSDSHVDDLLIQRIGVEGGEPHLHGICLRPEAADQFARKLSSGLREYGLEVQSPKKTLQNSEDGRPHWAFEIAIRHQPIQLPPEPKPGAKKAPTPQRG